MKRSKNPKLQKIVFDWILANRASFVIIVIGSAVTILMLAITLNPSYFVSLVNGSERNSYLEEGLDRVSAVASDVQILQAQLDISGEGVEKVDNLQVKTRYVCKRSDGTVNNWGYKTVTRIGVPENIAVLMPGLKCEIEVIEILPETINGVAWAQPEYTIPINNVDTSGMKTQLLKIGFK